MTKDMLQPVHVTNDLQATKIGVIGGGVVGGIVASYFREKGMPVAVYDKYKKLDTIEDVDQASVVFICVPTPYVEGKGLIRPPSRNRFPCSAHPRLWSSSPQFSLERRTLSQTAIRSTTSSSTRNSSGRRPRQKTSLHRIARSWATPAKR